MTERSIYLEGEIMGLKDGLFVLNVKNEVFKNAKLNKTTEIKKR